MEWPIPMTMAVSDDECVIGQNLSQILFHGEITEIRFFGQR